MGHPVYNNYAAAVCENDVFPTEVRKYIFQADCDVELIKQNPTLSAFADNMTVKNMNCLALISKIVEKINAQALNNNSEWNFVTVTYSCNTN